MRRALSIGVLATLGLTACSGGGSSSSFVAAPSRATPAPAPRSPIASLPRTPGGTARIQTRTFVPDSALLKTVDVPQGPAWFVERALSKMRFERPVHFTHAGDGSGRVFVSELRGVVWSVSGVTSSVFLDISKKVHFGNEEGLFAVAFHPRFAQNGFAYVAYATGTSYVAGSADQVRIRIARFQRSAQNPSVLDPATEEVLLEAPKKYRNHNGGQIAFGPDGYLYVGLGDGGCCGDPDRNAQNLGSLMGKILRLDVDGGAPYAIPADNPFVGTPGARGEVFSYGLRNPWRFSFDRVSGRLWVGDVGQDGFEEINLATKGSNHGWPATEGDHVYDATVSAPGARAPLVEYDHAIGHCVIGGFVYQGAKVPSLRGHYLFGDFFTGQIWAARYDGVRVTGMLPVTNTVAPSVCSFGEDEAGEVYVLSYATGGVYRIAERPAPTTFPQTLSATGIFSDLKTQTMRKETRPLSVVEPLWSDHAKKERHVLLPRLDGVAFTASDGWAFPADTILVKHFALETVRGDPKTRKVLETRLLVKTAGEWSGYSYEWNDQGTDGVLLAEGKERAVSVLDSGTPTLKRWSYPSRTDCLRCHTEAAGFVLGPQTAQQSSSQLASLEAWGFFEKALPPSAAAAPRLVAHDDPNASLDARARSYLHV
ncbi:MAG: PQQ-dependent sugar dehydrogenase, partial [Planctomycetota bacterium]